MWKVFLCDTGKILKGFEDEDSAAEYVELKMGQIDAEIDMEEMSEEEEEEYLEMLESQGDIAEDLESPSDFSMGYDSDFDDEDGDYDADGDMLDAVYDEDGEMVEEED